VTQPDQQPTGRTGGRVWPELVRFGLVGLVNTAFGFAVFVVLQLTLGRIVHYLVVLVVANVIAILWAYVLQRRLVFRFIGGWWAGLLRFSVVYLGAFAANLVMLPALHELLHIDVIPAQAIATVVQAFGTYLAHRLFTFRAPGTRPADADPAPSVLPGDDTPR
jgi:putative flippase GtrA